MRRSDPKMKTPGRGGQALGEAVEAGNLEAQVTAHCPTIAQRRADSIRKQAIGQIVGA